LVGLLTLLLVVAAPAAGRSRRAHPHAHRAQVQTFGRGSWCWFADPRAIHIPGADDETVVGWIDWRGAITLGAYDNVFGSVRTHVIGYQRTDDHASPSILVEPDDRLTVFWSGHDGPAMNYRTSLHPRDIDHWGPLRHVHSDLPGGRGFTYPNPEMLSAEGDRLYLFWRGADWGQDYATRAVGGSWNPVHRLIENPGQRPYVKVDSNGRDKIAMAFTDGHPREMTSSIYYASYHDGWLWKPNGQRIAQMGHGAIAPRQASLVYDGPRYHQSGWVWDVALDHHDLPVVVYATFPPGGDHAYWYARFNGRQWISHFLTLGGPTISPGTIEQQYSGGLALDHDDPSVVYLSRKLNGWFEIERWSTPNGGYSWQHSTVVRTPGENNVRPVVPRGPVGGPIKLLWLHGDYRSYTTYRTLVQFER
jgi:BNR repeat-containing family member